MRLMLCCSQLGSPAISGMQRVKSCKIQRTSSFPQRLPPNDAGFCRALPKYVHFLLKKKKKERKEEDKIKTQSWTSATTDNAALHPTHPCRSAKVETGDLGWAACPDGVGGEAGEGVEMSHRLFFRGARWEHQAWLCVQGAEML